MFKTTVSNVSRRLFSTHTQILQDSKSSAGYLKNVLESTEALTKDEKVNIRNTFINDFSAGEIYDPFDFSIAKLNIEKKQRKLNEGINTTFDKKRLNPLDFYTNPKYLSQYVTLTGRILPRDVTQLSLKNQKRLAKAIKRSRSAGLLSSVHKDHSFLTNTNFATRKS